jgi:predicted esterase
VIERSIAVNTHGRYLVVPPAEDVSAGLLVGFHGYAEGAESQLERLRAIPGSDRWRLIAIQGLHRFYQRRTNEVIASWMTRQDRDLAIADNLAYVEGVLDAVSSEWSAFAHQEGSELRRDKSAFAPEVGDELRRDKPRLVFAGFSQGVAMAFRAACATARHVDGIIAVGGDVPPEIDDASLARVRTALVCRGARDQWYTDETFQQDVARIRQAGAAAHPVAFDGGHEWPAAVLDAASAFLRDALEQRR